jgi:hypothetical protein
MSLQQMSSDGQEIRREQTLPDWRKYAHVRPKLGIWDQLRLARQAFVPSAKHLLQVRDLLLVRDRI